jgi:hypothetical protein
LGLIVKFSYDGLTCSESLSSNRGGFGSSDKKPSQVPVTNPCLFLDRPDGFDLVFNEGPKKWRCAAHASNAAI